MQAWSTVQQTFWKLDFLEFRVPCFGGELWNLACLFRTEPFWAALQLKRRLPKLLVVKFVTTEVGFAIYHLHFCAVNQLNFGFLKYTGSLWLLSGGAF
jgi:hypothetical protein